MRRITLIAHRLSTIAHAQRIHVLAKGHIVETGTHDSLLSTNGLTPRYGASRARGGRRRVEKHLQQDRMQAMGRALTNEARTQQKTRDRKQTMGRSRAKEALALVNAAMTLPAKRARLRRQRRRFRL